MAQWTTKDGKPIGPHSVGRYEPAPYEQGGIYLVPDYGPVRKPAANDSAPRFREGWFTLAGIAAALIVLAVVYG